MAAWHQGQETCFDVEPSDETSHLQYQIQA